MAPSRCPTTNMPVLRPILHLEHQLAVTRFACVSISMRCLPSCSRLASCTMNSKSAFLPGCCPRSSCEPECRQHWWFRGSILMQRRCQSHPNGAGGMRPAGLQCVTDLTCPHPPHTLSYSKPPSGLPVSFLAGSNSSCLQHLLCCRLILQCREHQAGDVPLW